MTLWPPLQGKAFANIAIWQWVRVRNLTTSLDILLIWDRQKSHSGRVLCTLCGSFFSQSVLFLCNNFEFITTYDIYFLGDIVLLTKLASFVVFQYRFIRLDITLCSIGLFLLTDWLDFDLSPSFDVILFVSSTLFHFRFLPLLKSSSVGGCCTVLIGYRSLRPLVTYPSLIMVCSPSI